MHDSEPVLPREEEVSTAVADHPGSTVPGQSGSDVPSPPRNAHNPTTETHRHSGQPPVVGEGKDAAEKDEEDDEEEQDDDYEPQGYASDRGYSDQEPEKDYTACSASDCGYCGHCGY
jgi:hypothetical protein